MAFKKNRPIKVYETSGTDYKRIPQIRLQGKWLQELGFDIGEVEEEITYVYSCPKCGAMKRPEKEPSLIRGSIATPSLVAGIMNATITLIIGPTYVVTSDIVSVKPVSPIPTVMPDFKALENGTLIINAMIVIIIGIIRVFPKSEIAVKNPIINSILPLPFFSYKFNISRIFCDTCSSPIDVR